MSGFYLDDIKPRRKASNGTFIKNGRKMYKGAIRNNYGNSYREMVDDKGHPLVLSYYDNEGRGHYINKDTGETYADYNGNYDNGVVVKPSNYSSSFVPEDVINFMNIVTLGLGNRLSTSQNLGIIKDLVKGKSLKETFERSLLGNEGVSDNPIYNLGLDMVAPIGLGVYKYVQPRYNIQNIRNLAYVNIKPYDYEWRKIVDFGKDLIKGKVIDSNDLERLKKWKLNPESSYDRARIDAWRIRTGNPQLYDTFTPIGDNYYTAEKDINRIIRNGDPLSPEYYTSQRMINGKLETTVGSDAVNGAGGNVGNIGIYPLDIKPGITNANGTGIFRMTDLWDLQPFKGHYDLFEKMLENGYIKAIQNPIRKLTTPLYRQLTRKGIDNNLLKMIRNNTPFYKEYGFNGKIIGDGRTKLSKAMNKFWNNHIGNLEAGSVLRTKPFTIVNEMPVNFDFVNEAAQQRLRKLGYPLRTTFGTINPPYIDVAFPFNFRNTAEVSEAPSISEYLNFRGKNSLEKAFNKNVNFGFDDIKDGQIIPKTTYEEDFSDKTLHFKYGGSVYLDSIIPRKKYGGININPANRGKFTATMQRTGKTAEELSRSSNPLTRKRAIFALNARKWNH